MGRAKMLKQLRKEARMMPVEVAKRQVGVKSSGKELIAQGIKEVEGEAVKEQTIYKGIGTYQSPINHLEKDEESLQHQRGKRGDQLHGRSARPGEAAGKPHQSPHRGAAIHPAGRCHAQIVIITITCNSE
jgi:hypothetical protein